MRQVVPTGVGPDYPGGERIEIPRSEEFDRPIAMADAVVLIGGAGGTLEVSQRARTADKPVLPLAASGGDAASAYVTILANWDRQPVPGITRDQFMRLAAPIEEAVAAVIELLTAIFGRSKN